MFKFIEILKQKIIDKKNEKERCEKNRELWREQKHNRKKEEIAAANSKMFNSICPINNNENCHSECIHFQGSNGKYIIVEGFDYESIYLNVIEPAKCKLWSKQP